MPACLILSQSEIISEVLYSKAQTSINNAQHLSVQEFKNNNCYSAVSHVSTCAIKDTRFYSNRKMCAWFAGVLPGVSLVPWDQIFSAIENKSYDIFNTFGGPFAIGIHNHESSESYLISDRCSQYPVFYSLLDNKLIFSTSFKTFFSCLETKEFDEKWLTDFLIFNFPLNQTTPIKNVFRMPAAAILTVSSDMKATLTEYAPIYKANIPDCSEKEMQDKTHEIFSKRIPLYYENVGADKYASGITSGFDARTAVGYKPDYVKPQLFTYGIAGTSDIEEGKRIGNSLGLDHHYICIDDELIAQLSDLVLTNTDYSGGLNPAMRCVLLFVYEYLAKHGIEGVVTGISADHFFRSSGATPHTLSEPVVSLVENQNYDAKTHPYFSIFSDIKVASEHLEQSRQFLDDRYDWTNIPISERLLTFNHYELSTKYFGGEISLAENFVSMASPYWDSEIRNLSYNTNLSTLTITPVIYEQYPYWKQHQLFSSLLERHPQLKNIPINGIKPAWYAKGDKFTFNLAKVLFRAPKKVYNKLFNVKEVPLENWAMWLGEYVLPKLLANPKELRLAKYIHPNILEEVIASEINPLTRGSRFHLGGKILTAELVLRNFD